MSRASIHRRLRACAGAILVVLALWAWNRGEVEITGSVTALPAELSDARSIEFETDHDAWRSAKWAEKAAYVGWFRGTLMERYEAIRARYQQHLAERRAASMTVLIDSFNVLYFAALGALLLPFWHWRRARGRRLKLCAYSGLTAALLALSVLLFTIALGLLKEMTVGLWSMFEPRLTMLQASAMTLYARADQLILNHDMPIGMALRQIETGADGPLTLQLLHNFTAVRQSVFAPCATLIEVWCTLSANLPLLLSFGMAAFFAWGVRGVLRRTWTLPARAIAGEPRAGRRNAALVVRAGAREAFAVVCLLPVLFVLGPATAIAMQLLVLPCVDAMFGLWNAVLGVLGSSAQLGEFGLIVGVVAVPTVLIAGGAILAAATLLLLMKTLSAVRLRLRRRVPLRGHDRLWRRSFAALLRAHWLPVLLVTAATPLVHAALPSFAAAQAGSYGLRIAMIAAGLGAATVTLFVWLGGARAIGYLWLAPLARVQPDLPAVGSIDAPAVESSWARSVERQPVGVE